MKIQHMKMYMGVAEVIAAASESRKLKVGAIAVKDGQIIGDGYNGTPNGFYTDIPEKVWNLNVLEKKGLQKEMETRPETIHAEMNMLSKIAKSTNSSVGCDVFCTHAPCVKCAIHLHQAGVRRVFYKQVNPFKPTKNGLLFLKEHGVASLQL